MCHREIIIRMRTTLSLDDDVHRALKNYAKDRSLTMGKAASELVRRALSATVNTRMVNGLVVFDIPGSDPVTSALVKRLELE